MPHVGPAPGRTLATMAERSTEPARVTAAEAATAVEPAAVAADEDLFPSADEDEFETSEYDASSTASTSISSSVYRHSYENGRRVSATRRFRLGQHWPTDGLWR